MKIILRRYVLLGLIGVAVVCSLVGSFYGNAVESEAVVELSHRDIESRGGGVVLDSLVLPHIRHHWAFNRYAEHLNLVEKIKAGRYILRRGMSVVDIVRALKLGAQSPVNVTFSNARTAEQLAGRLAAQIEADSISILTAINSPQLATELGYKSSAELFAIFIPNTYNLWWTISPEDFVRRMAKEYERFWTPAREEARKALNLSRVELSTLASIVYEESSKVDEMPRIAGVYVNRLRRKMRLQADPTVKYALGDFTLRRILHKHLEYDSPYNTYKYRGLPPSPIAVASIAAIESVLNYEKHNYLYFCARPEMDGYHNFTASYNQHLENARRYAAELNRQGVR